MLFHLQLLRMQYWTLVDFYLWQFPRAAKAQKDPSWLHSVQKQNPKGDKKK